MPNLVPQPVSTLGLVLLMGLALVGCGSPNAANIDLRKQNQKLQASVDELTAQHTRDAAALKAAQSAHPTITTLSADRLARLFTTHGLEFGRLTGGDNPDTVVGPDTMLRVYVVPIDDHGTAIKAAGAFTVEAFDLDTPAKPLIGTWRFPLEKSRDLFNDHLGRYTYVLDCPWQTVPPHANLTVKVTFEDELSGGQFVAQTHATVHPGPTTRQ